MTLTPQNAAGRSGFTLMELMVVLVLIGVMTAMILPEMKGTYEEALLHSTGRELANVLGVAYSRAVTVHQPHRVRLDKITHRYSIERRVRESHGQSSFAPVQDLPGGEGALDARISIELRKPGEDFSDASDADSLLASKGGMSFRDGDEAIVFYPDGTADAREIQLQDRDGFRLAIRINPTTARVQIKELERQ
jgi:type II secretion system protein H